MAYILPQALVYQEFRQVPAELLAPLRACIVGPNAQLVRYSEADEKDNGLLGAYNPNANTDYTWPNRSAGAVVDADYVKLYMDNALLLYFEDAIGLDSTITPVADKTNRIESDSVAFKANGTGYDRSAALLDRDVQVGDIVYLRGIVDSENVELWTSVRGFAYEPVASQIGSASSAAENTSTQIESTSVVQTAGVENCIGVTVDMSGYDGRADGGVSDVYTFTVIRSSAGGDLTTARVRVTSASGLDDVASLQPSAEGDDTAVGARGLVAVFAIAGSGSSCSASVGEDAANDLLEGQTWEVTVAQAFTAPTATAGGTYTGDLDTTYVVEVTRGGVFAATDAADRPQVTVYTVHGTDLTAPRTITSNATYFTMGTKGLTMRWAGVTGLRKGDKYLVDVTAEADGRASTLILAHNLGDLADATDLDLKLYIKDNVQITRYRDGDLDTENWTPDTTQITVASGITATHPEWTDGGVEQPLEVVEGDVYVEYRAWLPGTAAAVDSLFDVGELDAIPGALHPDNPLKYGVYSALLNSNGTSVKFIGVADPSDADSWALAVGKLVGRTDVYNIVPMSHDRDILNMVAGHVTAQSGATAGRWRGMVCGLSGMPKFAVVDNTTSEDSQTVLATIADDPDTTGTQYTLVSVPAHNGNFLTNGVRAGDIVRCLYTVDSLGEVAYSEYEIDEVLSEDSVRLVSGPGAAVSTAQKIEIWRNRTASEEAAAVAAYAGSFGDRRVVAVWPDYGMSGTTQVDSMYIAAMVAGRRSGVAPQRGLTHVALTGLDSVARTTSRFNADQLNTMAAGGVWIVTQDEQTGQIYTRHALTTDMSGLNEQEEMIRVNVDSISHLFLSRLAGFIGVTNVTPTTLAAIRVEILSVVAYLQSIGNSPRLGPQIIDASIARLEVSPVQADRIIVVLNMTVPAPLNNLELYLVI